MASSDAHPWIMLYYPVPPSIKRYAAEIHVARQRMTSHRAMPQLPAMEAEVEAEAAALLQAKPTSWRGRGATRIRVGLVSADFRLKVRVRTWLALPHPRVRVREGGLGEPHLGKCQSIQPCTELRPPYSLLSRGVRLCPTLGLG